MDASKCTCCARNLYGCIQWKRFDFPFLVSCCDRYVVKLFENIIHTLDPFEVVNSITLAPIPHNKKLSTMYQCISRKELTNAHSAAADVNAMHVILIYPQ